MFVGRLAEDCTEGRQHLRACLRRGVAHSHATGAGRLGDLAQREPHEDPQSSRPGLLGGAQLEVLGAASRDTQKPQTRGGEGQPQAK